jgi:hypothetical protein
MQNDFTIDCIGTSAQNGLSDGIIVLKSMWQWVAGITGFTYDRAISVMKDNLNYNEGWACRNFPNVDPNCYNGYTIEKVVNTYGNLVINSKIQAINLKTQSALETYDIYKQVSIASGIDYIKTQKILNGLYYWTMDGQIPTSAYLSPLVFKDNNSTRDLPADWNQGSINASLGNLTSDIFTGLKWALGIAAVGGVLYLGVNAYSASKTVRKLV